MSASAVHATKPCWFWNHLLSVSPNAYVSHVRDAQITTGAWRTAMLIPSSSHSCLPARPGAQENCHIAALVNGNLSPVTPKHSIQLKPQRERLRVTRQSLLHADCRSYKHPNHHLHPMVHFIICKTGDLMASLPYAKSSSMSKPWDFSVYLSAESFETTSITKSFIQTSITALSSAPELSCSCSEGNQEENYYYNFCSSRPCF